MKSTRLSLTLATLTAASAASSAWAQAADRQGWNVNRFEPAPHGDVYFGVDHPIYTGPDVWKIRGGLVADYAYRPLVVRGTDGVTQSIIDHAMALHFGLTAAFLNRFDVGLSLPVSVLDMGPSGGAAGVGLRATNSASPGDLRINARVRIVGEADRNPGSLHLGVNVFLGGLWSNTGSTNSDGFLRVRGYLLGAGTAGVFRWSAMGGFQWRPPFQTDALPNTGRVGTEIFLNAAVGLTFLSQRLDIAAEFYGTGTVERLPNLGSFNAEANLGVHYLIADAVRIGVAAGPGLSIAPGTPSARGLFQLAYAPNNRVPEVRPPADRDGDGVPDDDDLCPDVPRGTRPDTGRLGCPIGDRDHDGVPDVNDRCPTTPQGNPGDPARLGCPDGDDDQDGVLNSQDACRFEPAGAHPDGARRGCPLPDGDRDTVPDPEDHCPDQAGSPSTDPARNGCPGLVRVEGNELRILAPVFFATSRDVILPQSFAVLNAVADALRATPSIQHVMIEGHTDDVGRDDRNLELSNRRAQSVLQWMVAHGIEESRLESQGFGETQPIQPVAGLAGPRLTRARAQNRRVQFRIVPATH